MNILVNSIYYTETLADLEADIYNKAEEMSIPKDEQGFFDGEFMVTVEFIKFE